MLNGLGEEQSSSIGRHGLLKHPQEQILIKQEEQPKHEADEPIDDRRNDRVGDTNHDEEGGHREEGTPSDCPRSVFDVVDRAGGAAKEDELDVVDDESDDLQESTACSGETLQEDVSQEESRRLGEVLCEYGGG